MLNTIFLILLSVAFVLPVSANQCDVVLKQVAENSLDALTTLEIDLNSSISLASRRMADNLPELVLLKEFLNEMINSYFESPDNFDLAGIENLRSQLAELKEQKPSTNRFEEKETSVSELEKQVEQVKMGKHLDFFANGRPLRVYFPKEIIDYYYSSKDKNNQALGLRFLRALARGTVRHYASGLVPLQRSKIVYEVKLTGSIYRLFGYFKGNEFYITDHSHVNKHNGTHFYINMVEKILHTMERNGHSLN